MRALLNRSVWFDMVSWLRRHFPDYSNTAEARYEQFSAHRKQVTIFVLIVLFNALILSVSSWGIAPKPLIFIWYLSLALCAAGSVIACGHIPAIGLLTRTPQRAVNYTVWCALGLGISWSAGCWALYDYVSPPQRFLLIIQTITTAASGAVALSVVPRAVAVFALTAGVPIFLRLFMAGEFEPAAAAATAIAFVASILAAAWIAFHTFSANVNARLDLAEKNLVIQLLLKDFEDTTSDWLWATDSELRFTHLSERGLKGVRLSADEALGKTPEQMSDKDPDQDKEWRGHLDTLNAHKPFHDFLYESHHADGGVTWLLVSGKPRFDRDGVFLGYRGVMSDITAQVNAEEARKRAEDELLNINLNLETRVNERTRELRESNKELEKAKEAAEEASRAKDNFIANISHELRTPLNSIIGFSELMAEEQMGDLGNSDYIRFAEMIHESGRHLLEIVNDVLDLSKSVSDTLQINSEVLDIAPIAKSCAQLIQEQCERKDISFVTDIEPDLPTINGDPVRLRQVMLNVLSNAVKFTEAGGWIKFTASENDDGLVLRIADTGIGMNEEEIRIAMEPFGQADASLTRKYEGTGLGLPLTKVLVEHHGGRLRIDSASGQGTSVDIWLPSISLPSEHCRDDDPAETTSRKMARAS